MLRKLILLFTTLVLVAAASWAPVDKAEKQSEQVCKYIVLFEKSIDDLQVAEKFEVVRMNFNDLVQSTSTLEVAEQDDFEAAVNNLMEEANKLPEDITVHGALEELHEEIQSVVQSTENLKAALNCVAIAEES